MILCDANYGLGAYGMEGVMVHTWEPERSRVTIYTKHVAFFQMNATSIIGLLLHSSYYHIEWTMLYPIQ